MISQSWQVDWPESAALHQQEVMLQVCLRGYTIFKGYYKDEQNTREAIDADGSVLPPSPQSLAPGGLCKMRLSPQEGVPDC